jgi:uncharacterized protein
MGNPRVTPLATVTWSRFTPRNLKGTHMTDPNAQSPDPNLPPTPPQQPAQPVAAAPLSPEQDIQWGSFAHLGGILGFLPALIIWLVFKDRGSFTNTEGKEALNFQITLLFGYVISYILVFLLIGAILIWVVWILGVVFSIIAFLQAKDGKHYRYPFAIRLIK